MHSAGAVVALAQQRGSHMTNTFEMHFESAGDYFRAVLITVEPNGTKYVHDIWEISKTANAARVFASVCKYRDVTLVSDGVDFGRARTHLARIEKILASLETKA